MQTILLVEDNEFNRDMLGRRLKRRGFAVITAVDGQEGVFRARLDQPDLILMDIQLPEVSGLEVTKWIKEDDKISSIPVIAVTAFAMKGDEERIRQGGCEAYISKPISVATFIKTIQYHIGDGPET